MIIFLLIVSQEDEKHKMLEEKKMSEMLKNEVPDEEFRVDDDQKAEWCLEKIREAQKQKDFWKSYYDEQYRKVCESCDLTIHNMEAMLHAFFDTVPHKATKTQESYPLPSGKLVFKQQEPEYDHEDEAVIEWLKATGGQKYIKTKESLDWASYKKTLTVLGGIVADENGEIVPGIEVTERAPVFKVELKKMEG